MEYLQLIYYQFATQMYAQYVKSIYTTQKEDAGGTREKNTMKALDGLPVGVTFRPVASESNPVPIRQIAPLIVSSRLGDSVTRFFYSFSSRYDYRPEIIPSSQLYIPSPVQRQPSATLPIVIWQSDEP